jgi:hypothetical protein
MLVARSRRDWFFSVALGETAESVMVVLHFRLIQGANSCMSGFELPTWRTSSMCNSCVHAAPWSDPAFISEHGKTELSG